MHQRLPARYGSIGLGVAAVGVALALTSHLFVWTGFPRALNPMILVGAFVYLTGGFLAVAASGYRAGTKPFLWLRTFRVLFAASVVFAILRDFQG